MAVHFAVGLLTSWLPAFRGPERGGRADENGGLLMSRHGDAEEPILRAKAKARVAVKSGSLGAASRGTVDNDRDRASLMRCGR